LKITFLFWIVWGLVSYIRTSREREEQRLRASRLEGQLAQARLLALQARLHPHFLFNTLNMISSMIHEDTRAADKMIADLSDLLRITMDSSSFDLHPLADEIEMLKLYVDIMKARYRDKLAVECRIEGRAQEALVPGFILQPLVENSIKHGMTAGKKTEILVSASEKRGRLELTVEDNGPGIAGGTEDAIREGLGLTSTVERLENFYGSDHEFHLENGADGGLHVVVKVPFRFATGEKLP
jgi:two-component system LytT family sensor kinase